jgi:acyl-CoA synthetase (AMP-forming)/AMP-acid ligase II
MPEDVRPRVRLFGELLAHWARERSGDTALIFGDRSWTWAEFDERVRRLSGALAGAGVTRGDRVAFVDKNHPACLETTFAAAGVGAANAVVNWRLSGDELAYVLEDAGAKVVFVGAELVPALDAVRDRLPALERVVVVGGDHDEYEPFLTSAEPYTGSGLDEDDGVLIMYTSGTTGFPKGAVLTHRSVIAHGLAAGTAFPIGPGDVNLVAMPLFHVGGSCYAVSGFLYGEPSYLTREPDAASLIAQAGEAALKAFSRLKYLCYGASPMPLPLLRTVLAAWPDVKFAQVYGMTELSGAVTALDPEAHRDASRPERLASAGTALSGVDIRIVDPVTLEDSATGEVWIRTEQRMAGYLGKPEATAETIVDGWVRTGDVGRLDDGGFLFLEDRVKDMIITGGENVYSPEVERVVAEFPGVAEVAVIGVPDDRWGEQVKAVVAGEQLDADKLMEFCRERLAHYKCPRSVDVVEALPRNATGKILKRSLREPYWRDRDRNV